MDQLRLIWPLAMVTAVAIGQVLEPPDINLAINRKIIATATCGEVKGQPIKELYCSLAGATGYSPVNQYSYRTSDEADSPFAELRIEKQSFVQGGQNCDYCEAGTANAHPATNMVDGGSSWWQSPPLSRGMQYNNVNITLDLGQEFHVAYVWIQMANSPRPGVWMLERSVDYGKTWTPWQYFAETSSQCEQYFGAESLLPITSDDSVICTTDYSRIVPLEDGEIYVTLLQDRPSRHNFTYSRELQNFARATNIRLRLMSTKTLQGHLMDVSRRQDPTITRRYFYAIKEIYMGGRCVCNGHAKTCDVLDSRRPGMLLCRCEHNTCGDMCEQCCPGFEQKQWQRAREGQAFRCEPCNCHSHSEECQYDEELDRLGLSLDIHGKYEGGGRCQNCRDNTEGINCNKCSVGFYRPRNKQWNETDVCQPCVCDPYFHSGACAEETGLCQCKERFLMPDCRECAKGYYDPPECRPCDCQVVGVLDETCLPLDGQCPCKENYGGKFCEQCATGYTNLTAGCIPCECESAGSLNQNCSQETAQCVCKTNFGGLTCDQCADGYYNHPNCDYCDCDPSGTEEGVCDKSSGQCLCKPGFAGDRCDKCNATYYGYPNCQPCTCDLSGSKTAECDQKTGECPCFANFTGRTCDKCAAGFYDFPKCHPCSCFSAGSKGSTCNIKGECYCKDNFHGQRCDMCKPNFYNFPICEECNCNPNGVAIGFKGCDTVQPGELCSCRKHVTGRICDQCLPTFWDLKFEHPDGCIDCGCHLPGTLSLLNDCQMSTGQCLCKRHTAGRRCDKCAEGFYNMLSYKQLGCEPCNCDIGGAVAQTCDQITGQCRCRPRINGQACTEPIDNHYFPTLWHIKYEAEDGRTPEDQPVRFAIDESLFPKFSWRGFAVFSPIQDTIELDVDIHKSSVYRLLFHYVNPTSVDIDAEVTFTPTRTQSSEDVVQKAKITIGPSQTPQTIAFDKNPFVLNPGTWEMTISTKQRLFLDFIVLLPSEYYEGTLLKTTVSRPCEALYYDNTTCVDLLYPKPPFSARADATDDKATAEIFELDENDERKAMEKVPIEILPSLVGQAVYVRADDVPRRMVADLTVPADDDYVIMIDYYSLHEGELPVSVNVTQDGAIVGQGRAIIHHCPDAAFCRELVTNGGKPATVKLSAGIATVSLTTGPMLEFGLGAITLIRAADWSSDYLVEVPHCVRRDGICLNQAFPSAPNSILTEAEAGKNANNSIPAAKLPFPVANADSVNVLALDNNQATIDVRGVVPTRGHYIFIIHYYNPDNRATDVDVLLQHDNMGFATMAYCPSVSGCRTIIRQKDQPDVYQFFMEDKYVVSLFHNTTQQGPIYVDSIIAVPFHSYTDSLMKAQAIDVSGEYIEQCSDDHFKIDPESASDFCRNRTFSLTAQFNLGVLSCDCDPKGSMSFGCAKFGGQCQCRPNVIGRRCERCKPGFYNHPECLPCKCGPNQQCDDRTGQCFCPLHVEGKQCDKCVSYAFGYDPLIGCQLCGCHPQGSEGGQLQCDPMNGQCLCKENVGGRKCDACLPGFYGFPHCYECACDSRGTTPDVCDQTNARCICKKNVIGNSCETCKAGTFDLQASNPDGCSNCFCFGVTDQCRSSFTPAENVDIKEGWNVTDASGTVTVTGNSIEYKSSDSPPKEVYFLAPADVLGEQTNSYGLNLSFTISTQPTADGARMSVGADVVLVGTNYTLEYSSMEQPVNPKKPFEVSVSLVAEKFSLSDGSAVTRPQMMLVLNNLRQLRIKASYFEQPASAILTNVQLQTVSSDPNSINGEPLASSVEVCDCPAPYTGSSCQECALGYFRVKSGPYLGACVPCQCNSHSGSCDKVTGECFDCQHDTSGPHCEFCNPGFYGNATTGSPYSCLPCACPHPTRTNNFAQSCQVSETGSLVSCNCKPGYVGERCDRCDVGFFGEPLRLGGSCSSCFCNENNDLSIPGACHPTTGHCDKCEDHTTGTKCEVCTPWYYGDAVTAKNCSECKCDQCGSSYCDHQSGVCTCHPLVDGPNCDRCIANAWGFSSCRGCEQCNCAQASISPQCNMETGQCACMRGATGVQCEKCEHGFWDYGPQGCRKCDCEADLSMGTVCDVHTGQCQCQEGATGPRCDTCIKDYLRIPEFGCRYCDECVHSLNADLDAFGFSVSNTKDILGNVSTTALTGARLKRITVAVDGLKPEAEKLLSLSSEIGMDNLRGDVMSQKAAVADVVIKANRSLAQMAATLTKANKVFDETEEVAHDVIDRADTAKAVVDMLRVLAKAIGQDSGATGNRATITKDAEQMLETIRSMGFDDAEKGVQAAVKEAQNILGRTAGFKERRGSLTNKTKRIADESLSIANRSQDYRNHINDVTRRVGEVRSKIKQTSPFAMAALVDGVDDNEAAARAHLENANSLLGDAQALLSSIAGVNDQLTEQLSAFNSTREKVADQLTSYQSEMVQVKELPLQCDARVTVLQHEASRLSGIFGSTRLEAENAMGAANAYGEIGETIATARETAAVLSEVTLPSAASAEESRTTSEESANLLRKAADARRIVVNNLTSSLENAKKTIKGVLDTVTFGNKRIASAKLDMSGLGENGLLSAKVEKASEASADASDKLDTVHQFVQSLLPSLDIIANQTNATVTVAARREQDVKGARTQITQVKSVVPSALEALQKLQLVAANASATMDDVIHQMSLLRKKIALARDMANRIKVGARFQRDSSLQLHNPERITRSAAYTKIRFFFRTNETDGLLLYFGNEVGASGTRAVPTDDYVAVELVQGQPKLVIDLGSAPLTIAAETFAADGNWRRLTVERTGKTASLTVDSGKEHSITKRDIVPGSKSVLNLHQEFSKLYVGGVPGHARIPTTLRNRHFVGDIEQLTFHDDPVGLWNAVEGGVVNVQGAEQRGDMRTTTSANGISLNGEGYAAMNLASWNPRKQTEFMLSFRTYAREGLLLYIGKERDFMSLELNDGQVVLMFDCGSGRAVITSEKGPYNDGKWHMVRVHRVERHAKLTVDDIDAVEDDAPGTLFELSVTDVYYIGGVPSAINPKTRTRPFHGCIEKVQLEGYYVNLNEARSSKGVEPGCADTSVRVVTFDAGGAWSEFTDQPITGDLELTLRFKTQKTNGLLAYLADADKKTVFSVYLEEGFIVVESNGEGKDKDKLKTELSSANDGDWHFVTASRTRQQLRVDVDDLYSREVDRNAMDESTAESRGVVRFGNRADDQEDFVGCIGDVTLNGRFLDFEDASSSAANVQLTGCALAELVPTLDPPTTLGRQRSATEEPPVTPATFVPVHNRKPGECALSREPYGAREDSNGFRFGLHPGSRLEYDRLPEAFDKSGVFSLQFRATASSGVLFFATNDKHTDHLALYLKDGKVVFSYNSGSGAAMIESARSFLDGEWHTVRVEREGTAGTMTVDDIVEAHGESPKGTDAVDTQPPFYVGGLPTDLVPFATRVIPGSRPEFGGCLRDFRLNDVKFQSPSNEVGVVPCSKFEEDGLFFGGSNNSHAVLDPELVIGSSFSLEMEVKPRVKTGVIVSISASELDYLSLQLIDGAVKFALDNGGGPQVLVHKPFAINSLCDGHWHNIKIYKTKNLMTMTVDGKSGMKVIKKADSTETNTKDPLYLGGVPDGYRTRGLETREPYAGCVRVISMGTKLRRKKNISLANITIVGDVAHSCPIN